MEYNPRIPGLPVHQDELDLGSGAISIALDLESFSDWDFVKEKEESVLSDGIQYTSLLARKDLCCWNYSIFIAFVLI